MTVVFFGAAFLATGLTTYFTPFAFGLDCVFLEITFFPALFTTYLDLVFGIINYFLRINFKF